MARYRDFDGRTRRVERWGKTENAARSKLRVALQDRSALARQGELSGASYLRDAIKLWKERFDRAVEKGTRSPGSAETYQRHIDGHILPALGELRVAEATTGVLDRFLTQVADETGPPTAKACRSVLSGVFGLAIRYGAILTNPVRDVSPIEGKPRKAPRALTREERTEWLVQLDTDEKAVRRDLPDLTRFLLATGVRIGEAIAVLWSQVNFTTGEVTFDSTIIRVTGKGLLRKTTKTDTGKRTLRLPDWAMAMLQRRFLANPRLDAPVFPNTEGGLRDPWNTRRDLRNARGSAKFAWVTSHNFRKTAATILDEAGLTSRDVADQLGHARPSMTQDVYFGRKASNPRVVAALEDIFDEPSKEESGG
ncbi:MAG: tyrosine-type recombinase/integrase [Streptosporangiales bacterium]|nr:tyrosine-type recombinase/integrase [Streptosporangiales bacterium]